jgi:hypothetical protein
MNPTEIIGNRTRDFPTYSAVPQPTAPPRSPAHSVLEIIYDKVPALKETLDFEQKIIHPTFCNVLLDGGHGNYKFSYHYIYIYIVI